MIRTMCVVAIGVIAGVVSWIATPETLAKPRSIQGADRVAVLEEKVAALERLVAKVGRDEASRRHDDAALAQRLDEVLWQTDYLKTRGGIEDTVLRKLRRLDGVHIDLVIALGGDGKNRGWWCDDWFCGRSRKECADTTVLTIPQGDPGNCRPIAKAWCSDREMLYCQPTQRQCSDCRLVD